MTPNSTQKQPRKRSLSERDDLARDLYVRFVSLPGTGTKTSEYIAATSFDLADAFYFELMRRAESKPESD